MVKGECVLKDGCVCDREECRYWLPMQRYECKECGLKVVCSEFAEPSGARQLELDLFGDMDTNDG